VSGIVDFTGAALPEDRRTRTIAVIFRVETPCATLSINASTNACSLLW
jgi:hypothetical protein